MNNITIDYVNKIINEYEKNIKLSKNLQNNNLKNIPFKLSYDQIQKNYINNIDNIDNIDNVNNISLKSGTNLKTKKNVKELNL